MSTKDDVEMAIRFTEDFYKENKELIHTSFSVDKPVLVEVWKEKFFLLKDRDLIMSII